MHLDVLGRLGSSNIRFLLNLVQGETGRNLPDSSFSVEPEDFSVPAGSGHLNHADFLQPRSVGTKDTRRKST